jgi:hypothetical protein
MNFEKISKHKKSFSFTFISIFFAILLSKSANSLTTETLKGSLLGTLNSNSFLMASQSPTTPIIPTEIEHFLTITGTASSTVQTDLTLISLNVETLESELSASYRKNTFASNKLVEVFSNLGIPEKNVTTTSYDTNKQYRSVWVPFNSTWGQIFEGFKVSNKLEVRLSDLQKASELIDRALAIGSILVTNISFDYSKNLQKKLIDSLLPLAAKDAYDRAKISAQALRVLIDDVKSASVFEFTPFPRQIPRSQQSKMASAEYAAPEIFSGKTKVNVSVNVNFIITKE